ncbi:hypothetical protein ACQW02_09050 [Humitalea sp. 24SJ18S-53]|uniref:hypothetical protein n=1 Tax=Humitalea sp. 24SJ18S-53 TaxID=3422307 RepID=UPI003D668743
MLPSWRKREAETMKAKGNEMMTPQIFALIDRSVFAVALRAVAMAQGGTAIGTGEWLFAALGKTNRDDPAMPTCAAHMEHLLRESAGRGDKFAGVTVEALPRRAGWRIIAAAAPVPVTVPTPAPASAATAAVA